MESRPSTECQSATNLPPWVCLPGGASLAWPCGAEVRSGNNPGAPHVYTHSQLLSWGQSLLLPLPQAPVGCARLLAWGHPQDSSGQALQL